ncbi:hypothetical protein ACH8E3_04620 [Paenibacillus sp. CMAA1364]
MDLLILHSRFAEPSNSIDVMLLTSATSSMSHGDTSALSHAVITVAPIS